LKTFDFKDPHSQSNAKEIHPEHVSLDLEVDFDKHQIAGSATWDISPEEDTEKAIFDTYDMQIDSVTYANGYPAEFSLGKNDSILGSALSIKLKPNTKKLTIFYRTGPKALALQWMKPEQTFGKKQPYLY